MDDSQGPRAGSGDEIYDSTYELLFEQEKVTLLRIAGSRIERTCSNPSDHKRDVVHNGMRKFLQTMSKRETAYEDPARVLRAAVWQEGVRHSQICRRERPVDMSELFPSEENVRADSPTEYNSRALARATSFDPRELYVEMLDLQERLLKVTDKDLFVQRFIEGKSLAEIAQARGCAIMTVQRGVKKLRKELGMHDEGSPPTSTPDN